MVKRAKSARKANANPEKAALAGSAGTKPRRIADAEQACAAVHKKGSRFIKLTAGRKSSTTNTSRKCEVNAGSNEVPLEDESTV